MHYKLYLVCQIREHMTVTNTGPEQLREAAWAQQKWEDEKEAMDQVRSVPITAVHTYVSSRNRSGKSYYSSAIFRHPSASGRGTSV